MPPPSHPKVVMLVPARDGSWHHCPQIGESQTTINDDSSPVSAASCWVGWRESLTRQASNHSSPHIHQSESCEHERRARQQPMRDASQIISTSWRGVDEWSHSSTSERGSAYHMLIPRCLLKPSHYQDCYFNTMFSKCCENIICTGPVITGLCLCDTCDLI